MSTGFQFKSVEFPQVPASMHKCNFDVYYVSTYLHNNMLAHSTVTN